MLYDFKYIHTLTQTHTHIILFIQRRELLLTLLHEQTNTHTYTYTEILDFSFKAYLKHTKASTTFFCLLFLYKRHSMLNLLVGFFFASFFPDAL